jgi:hypothetical protein
MITASTTFLQFTTYNYHAVCFRLQITFADDTASEPVIRRFVNQLDYTGLPGQTVLFYFPPVLYVLIDVTSATLPLPLFSQLHPLTPFPQLPTLFLY